MKAVMVPEDTPYFEGICDLEGNLIQEHKIERKSKEDAKQGQQESADAQG